MRFAWVLIALATFTVLYAYVLYPLLLVVLARLRPHRTSVPAGDWEWPAISITIPVYNEAAQIDDLLASILRLDYPRDRLQMLVVSDASDDGTDERVQAWADRGVELLRMPVRGGKSAAENAARSLLRGEIIVNTDASVRIDPGALKPLIARFRDPSVGLASGRDVSVSRGSGKLNVGESGYVGYEMWLRELETQVACIVGASGCFYAIRRALHEETVPEGLSRDFAAALVTREHGLRAVTVGEALCYVPRVPALRHEYRRKVRTFTCGMGTLYFKRHLLNPLRTPLFAWMLFSHKVCRWLAPWAASLGLIGIAVLAQDMPLARGALAAALVVFALALIGWTWDEARPMPRLVSVPAFLVAGNLAVMRATINALRDDMHLVWEPSRREPPPAESQVATQPARDCTGS